MSFTVVIVASFVLVVMGHYALPHRFRWMWLLSASLIFYGIAGPAYVIQIVAVTALAYAVAVRIETEPDSSTKFRVLAATVALLVANLAVFKYVGFVNESLRSAFGWFDVRYPVPVIEIALPLGISFYTFLLIGYVVDVYRGQRAERHFGLFALYVTFFPKVVSGPIERAGNLLPQLREEQPLDYVRVMTGIQLMAWGAFKKFAVADRIAPFVNESFSNPYGRDGAEMTFATVLYAFQIYCDFSGYTDMAIGAALILGFRLSENFNRPYFATSIQDFWKRWHMSLTSWLTDYIYTPMARSSWIRMKWYHLMLFSLFVTFVISGFWHGAQWTFVVWGALHGAYLVTTYVLQKPYNKLARKMGLMKRKGLHDALKIGTTFALVCFAYIIFRAESLADAAYIVTHLHIGWSEPLTALDRVVGNARAEFAVAILGIVIVMAPEFRLQSVAFRERLAAGPPWLQWGRLYAMTTMVLLMGAFWGNAQNFIYFRF